MSVWWDPTPLILQEAASALHHLGIPGQSRGIAVVERGIQARQRRPLMRHAGARSRAQWFVPSGEFPAVELKAGEEAHEGPHPCVR